MNGYVLFQRLDGPLEQAQRSSRHALRKALEAAVPVGHSILGIILGPQEQAILQVLPRAS